jgi:hypothetical protein
MNFSSLEQMIDYVDWLRERFYAHEKIFDTIIYQR